MEGLRIFENPDFGSVRIISDNTSNELLFCASDVCVALGYANPWKAVTDHVDVDDLTKRYAIDNLGRKQQVNYVNESGLYSLILCSKLDKAKKFKHWVTNEVLPSIRKTGSYSVNNPTFEQKINAKMTFADWSAKFLNLNEASKLGIAHKIGKELGLDDALPQVVNAGTDHPTFHSATDLLKERGLGLSVQKFNRVLETRGIVKTATRPGKAGKVHSWKVLQPEYDKYGQNVQDPKFQNQTQIKWYDNLFGELLDIALVIEEKSLDM